MGSKFINPRFIDSNAISHKVYSKPFFVVVLASKLVQKNREKQKREEEEEYRGFSICFLS
jgi:hypothetical protein